VLIENVQINFGVISFLFFLDLVDTRKYWNLVLKLVPIISTVRVDD